MEAFTEPYAEPLRYHLRVLRTPHEQTMWPMPARQTIKSLSMKAIAEFRRQLQAGEVCLGTAVGLCDPLVTDALADSVDFVWIDQEHCRMSPELLTGHLLAARSRGTAALVRVPSSATESIRWVLDTGAAGVVVPQIRTAEEAASVVADCRYPPLGRRGWGPRVPTNYGRQAGREYADRANATIFVAVQIENAEALAIIDRIVAVPGIDSVVIGPQDLSASLGLLGEISHPTVLAAIDTIVKTAKAARLPVGAGVGLDPEYAGEMIRRGVQWLQMGGDTDHMIKCMNDLATEVRSRIEAA